MPGKGCKERKEEKKSLRKRAARELLEGTEAGAGLTQPKAEGAEGEPDEKRAKIEVPEFDTLTGADRTNAVELCHALYRATKEFGHSGTTTSQLGSHRLVQPARSKPCFTGQGLLGILQRHSDVFFVDATTFHVKLLPGGETKLPDAALLGAEEEGFQGVVPESLADQVMSVHAGPELKLQALRVELVRALFRSGPTISLHDLGQEPTVKKVRDTLRGMKLLDHIKIFPSNFDCQDTGNGQYMIALLATEVEDVSMIDAFVESRAAVGAPPLGSKGQRGGGKGGGKGKGKGHGGHGDWSNDQNMMAAAAMFAKGMAMMGKGGGSWGASPWY